MIGNYDGGKGRVYQKLINLMPPHSVYVALFLGGGSVMCRKRPSKINVGIDLDGDVIGAWREWVSSTAENNGTAVSSAMAMDAPIAGNGGASDNVWEFLCVDALAWLDMATSASSGQAVLPKDALVYVDPPYLESLRASGRDLYKHEFKTALEHVALLDMLKQLDCRVMVSGYWSELYADMLDGWETAVFDAYTRSGRKVEEWVWMNYARPERLHDYSFLGDDYRERERIKRKKNRWVARLQKMGRLERQAVLAAIEEAGVGV